MPNENKESHKHYPSFPKLWLGISKEADISTVLHKQEIRFQLGTNCGHNINIGSTSVGSPKDGHCSLPAPK